MKKNNIISIFLLLFMFCNAKNIMAEEIVNDVEVIQEQPFLKVKDVKETNKATTIILEALNKITAKSYKYNIKIGDNINFERLEITPLYCWKSSPDQVIENKALLKITETSVDGSQNKIFYGWMFSSMPSISSMEHPMYDIRVVDCLVEGDNNK